MKSKIIFFVGFIFLIGFFFMPFVSSVYSREDIQTSNFESGDSLVFDESMCQSGEDFLIQITPFGCSPAVVRSDLLEEQNVAVYCQLGATKINPLISVDAIKSISFSEKDYPSEFVQDVAFHPARAALKIEEQINSPILNNIGYLVVVLKEQANSSNMPEYIEGTLTAKLNYDIKSAFGLGDISFYLPEISDNDWENKFNNYGFWNEKGYLRAEEVEDDKARISIYDSSLKEISSIILTEGQESRSISLPGFDCLAGLKIKLEDLENPHTRVKLRINGNVFEVYDNKFLENRCQINTIDSSGAGEKVLIRCREDEGVSEFDLEINPKINLDFEDSNEEGYKVGDFLYNSENSKAVYLGFVGTFGDTNNPEDLYVYFVETTQKNSLSSEELFDLKILSKEISHKSLNAVNAINLADFEDLPSSVQVLIKKLSNQDMNIIYMPYTSVSENNKRKLLPSQNIFGKQLKIEGFAIQENKELDEKTQNYYDNAMEDYDFILDSFSGEKYSEDLTYGKLVLSNKIKLAGDLGQKKTVSELCESFEEKYSVISEDLKSYCKNYYKLSSSDVATKEILINGKLNEITFEGIYKPDLNEESVEIFVKGINSDYTFIRQLQKGDKFYVSESEFIFVDEIKRDSVVFDIKAVEKEDSSNKLEIKLNEFEFFGESNYQIRVDKIFLKKIAKVSLKPDIPASGTEANFGFKIGIEKRAIKLSPDKIKDRINELNENIEKWQDISDNFGQVVKGFKTACLATGVVLTAKNFAANLKGKSIARQKVMRQEGGWYEKCTDLVSNKEYDSIEKCLFENGKEIEDEVNLWNEAIKKQNEEIQDLQKDSIKDSFLGKNIDTDEFMQDYSSEARNFLEDNLDETIEDPEGKGGSIEISNILNTFSYDAWKQNKYSLEQLRDMELYTRVLDEDPDNYIAQKGLYNSLAEIQEVSQVYNYKDNLANELGISSGNIGFFEIGESSEQLIYHGLTNQDLGNVISGVDGNSPVEILQTSSGEQYFVLLDDSFGTDVLPIQRYENNLMIFDKNGVLLSENDFPLELRNVYFRKYDRNFYENEFKSSSGENTYVVRYYETEPYKGLPAIVPFDIEQGWYAATKQTLPVSTGGISAYEESGRVSSFWLCNVGANGIEEFNKVGDDICQMINLGTGQPYNQFSGLSEDEAKKRITAGQEAIEQASKQYQSGVSRIKINVGYGSINLNVGNPSADIPDMQCQDFMSPKDCQLLFNVCDPVICPSSRCDLGGAYPVQDVVQSGIIGGLTLCLPNVKEGIAVPICLSGIQAGIDGLLNSVFIPYRDCLQESLETGKMVGVCDEIYSIYLCEFLWRQALPLAKIAIPKVMESLLNQNTRGGGEYLGVQSALDNVESSADYFINYYGQNSLKAFNARSAEEAGTEICKVSISGTLAEGSVLIDSITEPDSPPQFHGRFDEIPFSSATVPPTSQYKVFYSIYSGKDSGIYYKIYLKGSESSFYQDVSNSRNVATGYIPAGEYASETKDFTAPSGYKEMCIVINNQEPVCGFKQVSTDFGVNYIADKYIEEQTTQINIKTESGCISGSASTYSLLNPNIEEGAQEIINPEIYNRGIIRICATDNPGQGTDAYLGTNKSRWVEVGYCGEENIKCWLDTESVKDVIKNTDIEGDVLEEVSQNNLDILRNKEGYLSSEEVKGVVKEVKDLVDDSNFEDAIQKVDENLDKVFFNKEKAELLRLRGDSNSELAKKDETIKDRSERIFVDEKNVEEISEVNEVEDKGLIKDTTEDLLDNKDISSDNLEKDEEDIEQKEIETESVNIEDEEQIDEDLGNKEYYDEDYGLDSILSASEYINSKFDSVKFISSCLNNKLLMDDVDVTSDIDSFVLNLDTNDNFVEIDTKDLRPGDIIFIGLKCDRSRTGIFESYSNDGRMSFIFSNLGNKVEKSKIDFVSEIDEGNYYIYKAYRYSKELNSSEKEDIKLKEKRWTLDNLEEIIARVEKLRGKYSENKVFVDKLVFDGILTYEECKEIRGNSWWTLRFGEKNMNYLKKILQAKLIS